METNLIFGLESIAVLAIIEELGDELTGKSIVFYVDNNSTISAMIKGESKSVVVDNIVKTFWKV